MTNPTTTPTAADELREKIGDWIHDYAANYDVYDSPSPETIAERILKAVEDAAPTLPVPVKEIEELYQKASPGPWEALEHVKDEFYIESDGETRAVFATWDERSHSAIPFDNSEANAELIVALVNAWPALRQLHAGAWSGWQPIETAYKPALGEVHENRYILGYIPEAYLIDDPDEHISDFKTFISVIWWEPNLEGGNWTWEGDMVAHPTHWMPLPGAPTPPSEGE